MGHFSWTIILKLRVDLAAITLWLPVRNLSSLLTHCELILKPMESSFWKHLASPHWTHKLRSHCELVVSFLLVCNWPWACCELDLPWACCEPFVRSSEWAHHAVVAESSLWVGLLWSHCVSTLWSHCLPHSERYRWSHCEHGVTCSSHLHWELSLSKILRWKKFVHHVHWSPGLIGIYKILQKYLELC